MQKRMVGRFVLKILRSKTVDRIVNIADAIMNSY